MTMKPSEHYHIAFFTNTYLPFVGGVARSVDRFQRALKDLGDRVVIYAPKYNETNGDEPDVCRLPAIRQFNKTDFSLPLPLSIKPDIDFHQEYFDIVHVHHPFLLGEAGLRLARHHHLPLVFTYHTQYEKYTHYVPFDQEVSSRTIIRHAAEFCEYCDLVIAPTHDIEQTLRERGVTSRIEVVPTGIELDQFDTGNPTAARERWSIPPEAPLLLHVGRLAHEKNLEYLLAACLRALEKREDAHLMIVGEGKNQDDLQAVAAESPVSGRVHFVGKQVDQDLIDCYAAADVFVFASKTETQGMVVAEAMAAATPVIGLDAIGIRELIKDGHNGRLLHSDAPPEQFASTILDALKNPDQLKQWGAQARQDVRRLDMPVIAQRLHELYRSLKLLPNAELKRDTMSFGLIRNYFETIWEEMSGYFSKI